MPPLLEMKGIVKRFPGVIALDRVDFDLRPGEVHILFGENGSGKSTLVNIIAGAYTRDAGGFAFQGREVESWSPQTARLAGISPVFQEFSLVPDLTVEENLFLGRERASRGILRRGEMRELARKTLDDLGFCIDPGVKVRHLSRADQQMTEIAKAILQETKVLILDEPTASLTERESTRLFQIIEQFKYQGVGVVYVSHRMSEIREVGDRITVLRDGRLIDTVAPDQVSDQDLVEMMTGRQIGMLFPTIEHSPGEVVLEVEDLSVKGRLHEVSLHLRRGEVVGLAGLAGGGKSEIARTIFGLERVESGRVILRGETVTYLSPAGMLSRGVFYVPADRMAEGLALPRPVRENISAAALDLSTFSSWGILKRGRERSLVGQLTDQLNLRPRNIETPIQFLSGGNQQKAMLLRGLTRYSDVFLFDDPTVGIDVGAKKEFYLFLKELTEKGAAVLFVSSELPELLNLSNRLYVAHQGRLVAEYSGDEINERNVLGSFFQVDQDPQTAMDRC